VVLRHNWQLKLLSVSIAVAVWIAVVSSDRSQVTVPVAVEYVGLGPRVMLVGAPTESVDVRLEMPRWAAGRVGPDSLRARVSLAGLGEGDSVVPLSPADIQAPAGATVVRVTPTRLRISLVAAAERTLPVVAQIRGAPAAGTAVDRIVVDPPVIQVKGPRSTIEAKDAVETVPVNVAGRRSSLTQTVGLVLPEFVYATRERSVQVSVEIKPEDGMIHQKSQSGR
jgi:hypothetical protein